MFLTEGGKKPSCERKGRKPYPVCAGHDGCARAGPASAGRSPHRSRTVPAVRGGHHLALSAGLVLPTAALVGVGLGLTLVFEVVLFFACYLLLKTVPLRSKVA